MWQPISEAPKDGTYVLLSFPGSFQDVESPGVAVGRYYADQKNHWWVSCIWGSGEAQKEPTHFMPLPKRAQ